jgi:hypothetical protein
MSLSDAFENNVLLLVFNATTWADYAENDTTGPHTQIATALATGDPGDAGTMSTSEVTYTDYARVNINRNSGGFTVTANAVVPAAEIAFVVGSGGSGTVTHFSWGKTGGGATAVHCSGTVTPNIVTGTGITPKLTVATTLSLA